MIENNKNCMKALIIQRVQEIYDMWNGVEEGKAYIILNVETAEEREMGIMKLQPKSSPVFYGMKDFIDIAEACGYSTYVRVANNMSNVPSPVLVISI